MTSEDRERLERVEADIHAIREGLENLMGTLDRFMPTINRLTQVGKLPWGRKG